MKIRNQPDTFASQINKTSEKQAICRHKPTSKKMELLGIQASRTLKQFQQLLKIIEMETERSGRGQYQKRRRKVLEVTESKSEGSTTY